MVKNSDVNCYKNHTYCTPYHQGDKRYWTYGTQMCYERGCKCNGCEYNAFMLARGMKCQIKYAVNVLIKRGVERKRNFLDNDETD